MKLRWFDSNLCRPYSFLAEQYNTIDFYATTVQKTSTHMRIAELVCHVLLHIGWILPWLHYKTVFV
jgi:hypothetical protein